MHWLIHVTGGDNVSGLPYAELSGFLSIVVPFLLQGITVAVLFLWHHQCHVTGCYWPTRRLTAAGERACWRHHPHPRRSAGDLANAHHEALTKGPSQ